MNVQYDFSVPVRLRTSWMRWASGTMGVGSSRKKSLRSEATVGTSCSSSRSTLSPLSHRCLSCLVRTTEPQRRNRPLCCIPVMRNTECIEIAKQKERVKCGKKEWQIKKIKQKMNERKTERSQKQSSKDEIQIPFLSRNSTMSLSTRGIPHTVCPSSRSVSKATPNTHLAACSGSETSMGGMGSGYTLALGIRILTDERSFCTKNVMQQLHKISSFQKTFLFTE